MRVLPRILPDVSADRRRNRISARAHLLGSERGRRQARLGAGKAPYRPVPRMPGVRDGVPQRRGIWPDIRNRPEQAGNSADPDGKESTLKEPDRSQKGPAPVEARQAPARPSGAWFRLEA